jgi:lipocalin
MTDSSKKLEDQIVVQYYKNFVGEKEVESLTKRFNVNEFCSKWDQVLTSRTTGLFGTGITYSSVTANYSLNSDGTVKVVNTAYDTTFQPTAIEGKSRARDPNIPTCRTVNFPSVSPTFEGDYWIIYISPTFETIIVGAPLILPGIPIELSNNFGVYVLAKNRDEFWSSNEETTLVFDTLKKYGFTQFWNEAIYSGKSFTEF